MRIEYTKNEVIDYNKIRIIDENEPYFWSGKHLESKEFLENFCKNAYKLQLEKIVPETDEEKEVVDILSKHPINIFCNNLDIPLTVEDGRHRLSTFKKLNLPYKFPIHYNLEFQPFKDYEISNKSDGFFGKMIDIFTNNKKITNNAFYTLALPNVFDVKEILEDAGLEPVIAKEYNGNNNYLIVDTRKLSLDEILEIIPIDKNESFITIGKNESIEYDER